MCAHKPILRCLPSRLFLLLSEHSFIGYNTVQDGFKGSQSMAAWSWDNVDDATVMFQGISQLLQAVSQELQEPDHVLMPYEHCNAA
jgi:hypothetical protein